MENSSANPTTEQIWRELSDRLRQFIQSRNVTSADADDVLQNVFLRIHQNLENLERVERLESWVFQITRNAVVDHFRKSRVVEHNVSEHDVSSIVVTTDDSQAKNLNSEVAGCLRTLVERLPDDQRSAVSLYELEAMSQKEIAERESISLSGAKSRIQRGRQALERMLRDCCQFQFDQRGNVMQWQQSVDGVCGSGDCGCGEST